MLVDLTDPESIRRCVDEIQSKQLHIQVLVNNAGVSMVHTYTEAPTGVELTCQTNYIGVVELTDRMIPLLLFSLSLPFTVDARRIPGACSCPPTPTRRTPFRL